AAHRLENVLALRGDVTPGATPTGEFAHASEVAAFINEQIPGYFNIIGACYPETHPEAASAQEDLRWTVHKVDAGVSQLATQLFFDNRHFYAFLERAHAAGITVPIQAGIMPVVNARQAARMVELCGANIPAEFAALVERYGADDAAMRAAGIDYAIRQILDLIEHGVCGIHLYTMNDPATAAAITAAVKNSANLSD
ncbi:MAG: methylenetetrahydrofolate reductase, partial [Actinomycetia bacterium]|nr:methylenetetrahydrofolate reductase [Actinomycetes bacterium]